MRTWIDRYAEILGITPPSDSEIATLLDIAGVAADASERTAAPVSCWMAALAQRTPSEALIAAQELADAFRAETVSSQPDDV